MMGKRIIYKSVLIIAVYWIFIVLFNGCCGDNYSRLKGINQFYSFQTEIPSNPYVDTISGPFQLYTQFDIEYIVHHQPAIVASVYAFQPCPRTLVNPIDQSSIKLTLNKDFLFGLDTIKNGTSILDLEGVNLESYLEYDHLLNITFDSVFLAQAAFNYDWYDFNISMVNFDTIPETFSGDISLFMNPQ